MINYDLNQVPEDKHTKLITCKYDGFNVVQSLLWNISVQWRSTSGLQKIWFAFTFIRQLKIFST